MPVSKTLIRQAAEDIAAVEGLCMSPDALLEDVFLLALAFPEQEDFMAACVNTRRALTLLVEGKVDSSALKHGFAGWRSYHYQHRVGQGVKATCRIVFRAGEGGIEVKGFGHRHIPGDIYEHLSASRNKQTS